MPKAAQWEPPPGGRHLVRSPTWAGLARGSAVTVEGPRLRGSSWRFLAHVRNLRTGEEWVEVVGGRTGDRAVRSFRPEQVFPVSARGTRDRRPSLADAPQLSLE